MLVNFVQGKHLIAGWTFNLSSRNHIDRLILLVDSCVALCHLNCFIWKILDYTIIYGTYKPTKILGVVLIKETIELWNFYTFLVKNCNIKSFYLWLQLYYHSFENIFFPSIGKKLVWSYSGTTMVAGARWV